MVWLLIEAGRRSERGCEEPVRAWKEISCGLSVVMSVVSGEVISCVVSIGVSVGGGSSSGLLSGRIIRI